MKNLVDTSLTPSMTRHCHSARAQLCFAHLIVIPNAVFVIPNAPPVILNAVKNLIDTSLTLSMTRHCHSARAQLCFAHLIVILNAVKNLFNNAQNEMSNFSAFPFWGKVD